MTHKTRAIVIKTVKYGETSIVASMLTSLFGLQTYLINGVRKQQKKGEKSILYQPGAILDLVVYHQDQKNLQRIKEAHWAHIHEHILSDVIKHSIASFMMELLQKTIRQPETNIDLFEFCEDCLVCLDKADRKATANFPLFFALQLPQFFGFKLSLPNNQADFTCLDLKEGFFLTEMPDHPLYITGEAANMTAELLKASHPTDLDQFDLNQNQRRTLIQRYMQYYSIHVPEFGQMKTLAVMYEVFG
jgi:DNA repair protein RecO (recombination protein O)